MGSDGDILQKFDELRQLVLRRQGGQDVTLGELWEKFWPALCQANPRWKRQGHRGKALVAYFGSWPVKDISSAAWQGYRAARMEMPTKSGGFISAQTVNLELDMLKYAARWGIDNGVIEYSAAIRIKREKVASNSQAPLRERDLQALLAKAANQFHAAFIINAFDGGFRLDELRRLRWPDIDPHNKELTVRRTKNGRERTRPVTQRAINALLALPRMPGMAEVFVNFERKRMYSEGTISRWTRTAVKESGVEFSYGGKKIRTHALRHGYATNAIERGLDIRVVQEQLDHSSLSITEKYLHARREHLRAAAEIFEAGIARDLARERRRGPRRVNRWPARAQEPLKKNAQ